MSDEDEVQEVDQRRIALQEAAVGLADYVIVLQPVGGRVKRKRGSSHQWREHGMSEGIERENTNRE